MAEKIQRVGFYTLALFIISLLFYRSIQIYFLSVYLIVWILEFFIGKKKFKITSVRSYLLLIAYLIVLIAGLFYTKNENLGKGLFDIQVKSSLFFMPLIVAGFSDYIKQRIKGLYLIFVAGVVLSAIVCLTIGLYHWISLGDHHYMYYGRLSLFKHPTYFAMYMCLAIVLLFKFIKDDWNNKKLRTYYLIVLIFFYGFLYLLSSKAGIFTSLMLGVILPVLLISKRYNTIKWVYFTLMILISVVIVLTNPRMKSLASHIKQYDEEVIKATNESSLVRILIWKASINKIKQNTFFGVGTGDLKPEMLDEYKKNGYTGAYEGHLNPHNQYLETMVANGLIGVVILILIFIYPLILSIRKRSLVPIFFFIIILFNLAFESILDRQSGNMFISLFYSIFVFL